MTGTAKSNITGPCPYFHQAKTASYLKPSVDGFDGYGYCYAYGTDRLRVASVRELFEYCNQSAHVRCPVYEWLRQNGRLSLVAKFESKSDSRPIHSEAHLSPKMIPHSLRPKHTEDLKEWPLECPLIYGPLRSRRHGLSLGVNLLPTNLKVCNFDCLYCQCGRSSRQMVLDSFSKVPFLPLEEIERGIAGRFRELERIKVLPDTIVFSGNGEPTLHPRFAEACEVVKKYRDRYLPESRVGILTNGTKALDPVVFEATAKLDWRSVKLDAGASWLNHPMSTYDLEELIPAWRQIPELTVQSFFSEGPLTNTRSEVVELWIQQIQRIRPRRVHIYTLDRTPAVKLIEKASLTALTQVARRLVYATGIQVEVFD